MQYNRELIQKADMLMGDLTDTGALVPAQAKKFIQIALRENVLSSQVRGVIMSTEIEYHPKMSWTGRVMHAATPGVALPFAQRSKPGFDRMVLTSKLGKAEVHMPREFLEDQIERGTFKNTLVGYMGEKVAEDVEDLLINGNTGSADDWLATQNGLLVLATSNTVPAGVVTLTATHLEDAITTMPDTFMKQKGLAFFTNRKAVSDYRATLRTRATPIGDGIYTGQDKTLGYDGFALNVVPHFPNNLGALTNQTSVLFFAPKNAVIGFHRKITVDTEFRISEQIWAIVMTMRIAINYEHEPAVTEVTQVIGQ